MAHQPIIHGPSVPAPSTGWAVATGANPCLERLVRFLGTFVWGAGGEGYHFSFPWPSVVAMLGAGPSSPLFMVHLLCVFGIALYK